MIVGASSSLDIAHGARVVGMVLLPDAAAALLPPTLLLRNVSVGASTSEDLDGVQVQGNSFEKTKCCTTCRLSSTSP